jgi:RNA polymerase sigma-70 factor (ECF subfamily)
MANDQSVHSDPAFDSAEERDDSTLLAAIAADRDKEAFGQLFERYKVRAYNLAFNLTQNRAMAEDAVQDAMLALWQSPKQIDPAEGVQGWILGIVAHKSLSLVRTRARSQKREQENRATESYEMENVEADTPDLIQALRKHIEQLPALERQILTLKFTEGLPQEKIGTLLAIPQQTISRRIQAALERLRSDLKLAGMAAVVPLVSPRGLSEAVSSGHAVPLGLGAKVMSRIAEGGATSTEAVRSLSRRAPKAAAKKGAMAWIGAAALTLALGAAYFVVIKPQNTPSSAPSQSVRAKFERQWDFSTPQGAADLKPIKGTWNYLQADGQPSGCMETADGDTEVVVNLEGCPEGTPLRVTFDWRMMTPARNYRADVRWEKHAAGFGVVSMGGTYKGGEGNWVTNTIYVTSDFIDTHLKTTNVHINVAKKSPGSRLLLQLHGGVTRFDNLKVTEIKPDEMPSVQPYIDAARKTEISRQNPNVVLEGVKPLYEGAQVGAYFIEATE